MTLEHPINYSELQDRLSSAGFAVGPAEAHGVLCSVLCCGKENAMAFWLEELTPPDADNADLLFQETKRQLERIYHVTNDAIDGPGGGFELLIPDDEASLTERATAIVEWCQGYLYGLGLASAPLHQLSKETQEGLRDITEITRLDLESLSDSEQEEIDLTEVTEFIWVAAMLVREELVRGPKGE